MICLLLLTLPLLGNSVPVIQGKKGAKIVGGNEAKEGEWPWQVSLRAKFGGYWIHICGGSLIHPSWILTAAHCVESAQMDTSRYMIQLRQQNLYEDDELVPLEKIIIHPEYDHYMAGSDLALLKLQCPVQLTNTIQTITLPEVSQIFTPDMECWVTGWGNIKTGVHLPPPYTLRQVQVPLLDAQKCDEEYHVGAYTSSSVKIITDDMLCAGKPNVDSCQGDSGGPLVCKVGDSWKQAGVVSWGLGCGLPHRPGIYTRVTSYVDWINKYISPCSSANPARG
ncbi:tryptase alpha/beta-1-like [Petaurus breviceps papuanus]|uniref:tryptase alpha/beta-1-like n=1 Tax=Petaurus breviceps papuanus TaxID=3040969 RepID=UPI0036D97CBD